MTEGAPPLPDDVAARVAEIQRRQRRGRPHFRATPTRAREGTISPREAEVAALIGEGMTNAEIGRRMGLTSETVKAHVRNALARTSSRNRSHLAVRWALGALPVFPPPPEES